MSSRIRFCFTSRFKITEDFKTFAKSYAPTFTFEEWNELRAILIDLFFITDNRKADIVTITRPLIDERGTSKRIYVTSDVIQSFKSFYEPGEVLEVAYRCHQFGRTLDRLVSERSWFAEKRNKLMSAKQSTEGLK